MPRGTKPAAGTGRTGRDLIAGVLAATVAGLTGGAAVAADDGMAWRTLGAGAQGFTFATGLLAAPYWIVFDRLVPKPF